MPLPSLHDVAISAELLFLLWPLRFVQRLVESDITKRRRDIIHHHIKAGHKNPLKRCHDDGCTLLTDVLPADHF